MHCFSLGVEFFFYGEEIALASFMGIYKEFHGRQTENNGKKFDNVLMKLY